MSDASIDIERVVQAVLRELRLQTAPVAPAACPAPPVAPSEPEGQLTLTDRVITLSLLDGRLAGLRRLVVAPRSVITPAVRDELDRRGVQLVVGAVANMPAADKTPLRLVLVTHGRRFDPTSLLAALRSSPLSVEHHALDCILATSDLLAAEVAKPETLGAVLTRHTAAGLCVANRLPGVRAVLGADVARIAADAAAVGANLLVADPAGGSLFWLRRLLEAFCAGGVRECPEVFRKRLA